MSKNRFERLAQNYLEENTDILTLPSEIDKDVNIDINTSPENLNNFEPTDLELTQNFPNINWNFFENVPIPESFNDDVQVLIEHLANLQVPITVLDKAVELIYQTQGPTKEKNISPENTQQLELNKLAPEMAPAFPEEASAKNNSLNF